MAGEKEEFLVSSEEARRFQSAFEKKEFRDLFVEYAEEISDPENKKLYEKELTELEQQRGVDLQFVHPEPGFVVKAFLLPDRQKAFINVCHCDVIEKAKPSGKPSRHGSRGQHWNIPFSLSPPRDDYDKAKNKCVVFDVIFHPETYQFGQKDPRMKKLLIDTALEGIEKHLHSQLDRDSLKELRMTCKGRPDRTVIRKKNANAAETAPTGLEFPYPPLKETQPSSAAARGDQAKKKKTKGASEKLTTSSKKDSSTAEAKPRPLVMKPRPKEPEYRVVHRGEFSMQDFTFDRVSSKIRRPRELVITVELPGVESASKVELDIFEKQLLVSVATPPYCLDLALPYPVNEERGTAKFDKAAKTLTISLPVLPLATSSEPALLPAPLVSEIDDGPTNQEPEAVSHDSDSGSHDLPEDGEALKDSPEELTNQDAEVKSDHVTQSWLTNQVWSCPPFSYRQDDNHVIFLLYTSSVKEETLVSHFDTHECHVTFAKGQRGFSLYLSFPPPSCSLLPSECRTSVSERNVLLLLRKAEESKGVWAGFRVGVSSKQSTEKCFLTVENVENALAELSTTSTWEGAGWPEGTMVSADTTALEDQLLISITEPSASSDDVIDPPPTSNDVIDPSPGSNDVIDPSPTSSDDVIDPSPTSNNDVIDSSPASNDDVINPPPTSNDVIDPSPGSNDVIDPSPTSSDDVIDPSPSSNDDVINPPPTSNDDVIDPSPTTNDDVIGPSGPAGSDQPPLVITESGKNLKLGNQFIYSLDLD